MEEISYKELCQRFKMKEVRGGKQRENQINKLKEKYLIEKEGKKYVVIREKTEEEIQNESDRNHYSRYLQNILLNIIADNPAVTMTYTYRQLREELMMVNIHYFPVKYKKEQIDLLVPYDYKDNELSNFQKQWFDIADSHDSATIKYALNALKQKHLITSLQETYIFYKFGSGEVFYKPEVATEKQTAEIQQREMDFIKRHISKEKIIEIENSFKNEEEAVQGFYGRCLYELFKRGQNVLQEFYSVIENYTIEHGYNRYAKAFSITRPVDLKKNVGYFAPTFNKQQVYRYISSNRFKVIPPFIHKQLIDKLIQN